MGGETMLMIFSKALFACRSAAYKNDVNSACRRLLDFILIMMLHIYLGQMFSIVQGALML